MAVHKGLLFCVIFWFFACGNDGGEAVDNFCLNGQESRILFLEEELGRKEWDGDSYWTEGNEEKVRLLGVDFPDIKDRNNLTTCTPDSSKQNCKNWYRAFGTLDLVQIEDCYYQGLDRIRELLEGRRICLVEDSQGLTHPFGNLLRYIEFEDDGEIVDYSEWLISQGLAIPWDDRSDYGDCERCDLYQDLIRQGCLWE